MGVRRFEDLVAWQLAYQLKKFARFLRIAGSSLHETKNHLHDGNNRHYLSDSEHERLVRLAPVNLLNP
jgi:hypothetical protein